MNSATSAVAALPAAPEPAGVAPRALRNATTEPAWVQRVLIGVALAFMTLFLFVPLATVFYEAFKKGWDVYLAAIVEPDALSAIKLTLLAAAISVPLNLVFGVAAAWAIAKFEFHGKNLLLTLKGKSISVSSTFLPRKSNLAMAQAADTPKTRFAGTLMAAASKVSAIAERASGSRIAAR